MKKGEGLAKRLLTGILSAMLILAALPVSAFASTTDSDSKTITVTSEDGASAIQNAINEIYNKASSSGAESTYEGDEDGWTIRVESGTYSRFIVPRGVDNLTIVGSGSVIIETLTGDSLQSAYTSTVASDYGGIIVSQAANFTLKGVTITMGNSFSGSWQSAIAVANGMTTCERSDGFTLESVEIEGNGVDDGCFGVFIDNWCNIYTITSCTISNVTTAIYNENTEGYYEEVVITNNTFTSCSFTFHGAYIGSTSSENVAADELTGTFMLTGNNITGTDDRRNKVVVQDACDDRDVSVITIKNNILSYAMIGVVNICEENGDLACDVLNNNTFGDGSYYVEAIEPGTVNAYATYYAPENSNGYWAITSYGLDPDDENYLEVDWGGNPDGTIDYIQSVIKSVNEQGLHVLTLITLNNSGEADDLIRTFTWFKDAIYWYSGSDEDSEKDSSPGIEKKILADTNDDNVLEELDSYSVNAGDTVTFQLTSNVPDYLLSYLDFEYTDGDDESDNDSDEEDEEDGSTGNSDTDTDTDSNSGSTDTDTDTGDGTTENGSSDKETSGSGSESSESTVAAASADDGIAVVNATVKEESSYVITFHDVLNSAFTLDKTSFTVTIGGKTLDSKYYTLVFSGDTDSDENVIITDGCTFELSIDLADLYRDGIIDEDNIEAAAEIVVTYNATLSSDATAGDYTNQAWVEYEGTTTDEPEVDVYVYGIKIYKIDEDGTTTEENEDGTTTYIYTYLAGATFTLYSDEECTTIVKELTTDEDGYLCFDGLAAGTYYLVETSAPEGYVGSTAAVTITLPEDDNSVTSYYYESIINNAAIPNTGGMGTTILYIIGAALVLCAGIVLVTRKRMNGGD